ncbi:hypothetical protein BTS2_1474 [Bacillus sp. TS-2]|nr:hypothetical protein BTS2_1474 [Bacillus sp. TS-2]
MNVKLLDGIFKQSREKGKEYLLYLDVDRLIAPCFEAAGKVAKKERYGGWEKRGISGHSIGHWLSATASMYVQTRDQALKDKLDYAISELAELQKLDNEGFIAGFSKGCFDKVFTGEFEVSRFNLAGGWVPWYSIHKIYAGLIDTYHLAQNKQALEVVLKLADWAKEGLQALDDEQFEKMLYCEHGGMNEVYADLYLLTGNEEFLQLAIRFCHKEVLEPLAKGIDELEGRHANTQIPKLIGAAKLYNITKDDQYKKMVTFFWNQVTKHRSYVIGGNSIDEHFGPEKTNELGIQTAETCNTYNMLKLTEILFSWEQKAEYMNFYERALYNHILASQDPETGMKTYFIPTEPGHFKIYCTPDESFWCCTGTGMENPARYINSIYYQKNSDIFVNLFISSELTINDGKVVIKQKTLFPESNETTLIIEKTDRECQALHVRIPDWCSGHYTVLINDQEVEGLIKKGYLKLEREWMQGDQIKMKWHMSLYKESTKQDPNKVAFLYGPIVLAGALGRENFPESDKLDDHLKLNHHPLIQVPTIVTSEDDINKWIKPIEGRPLEFMTAPIAQPGNLSMRLIPFYQLHHERYTLYWTLMNRDTYEHFIDEEKEKADELKAITIDVVNPHEQQPEIEHHLKSHNSRSGYSHKARKGWRDCIDGFFSYELKVLKEEAMMLRVTYSGDDAPIEHQNQWYKREFSLFVEEEMIASQQLNHQQPGELFTIDYELPISLTNDKSYVTVRFSSATQSIAGGVYEVRMISKMGK